MNLRRADILCTPSGVPCAGALLVAKEAAACWAAQHVTEHLVLCCAVLCCCPLCVQYPKEPYAGEMHLLAALTREQVVLNIRAISHANQKFVPQRPGVFPHQALPRIFEARLYDAAHTTYQVRPLPHTKTSHSQHNKVTSQATGESVLLCNCTDLTSLLCCFFLPAVPGCIRIRGGSQ